MGVIHTFAFALGVLEWVARAGGQPPTAAPLIPPDTYDTVPPPPPGPDRLNQNSLDILIVLAVVLVIFLCAVLLWVWLCGVQRMNKEEKARKAAVSVREELMEKKKEAEVLEMQRVQEKVHELREVRQRAHKEHARFIQKHQPERFSAMKKAGQIEVEGDSSEDWSDDSQEMASREFMNITKEIGVQQLPADDDEREKFRALHDVTREWCRTKRDVKAMKKDAAQEARELELQQEVLALEERLQEIEERESELDRKRVTRKQEARLRLDQYDQVAGGRLLQIGPGGKVIRAPGHEEREREEPYDSDEDISDSTSEVPAHLENLSPRGKLLRQRVKEMKQQLDVEKKRNEQRQNKLERDLALVRRRQEQAERRERAAERKAQVPQEVPEDSNKAPPGSVFVGKTVHHFDVPRDDHSNPPRFIHAPWNVTSPPGVELKRRPSGVARRGPGTPERISPPGRRRSGSQKLLQSIAAAMKKEGVGGSPGAL